MHLAEYLASEQAREDVRLVVAKPHDVLRYSGNGGPWLERTTLKAWTRLGIEGADHYITAYYRPDGDRYVVTDLGEGVRALRIKGCALLGVKPKFDDVLMQMYQEGLVMTKDLALHLIELANERGGCDNTTVIAVEVAP